MLFETLLGSDFDRLHPQIQKRYRTGDPFYASGTMTTIQTGPKLFKPLYKLLTSLHFVFPEQGKNIPFDVMNVHTFSETKLSSVRMERQFHFPHVQRAFNSTMEINVQTGECYDFLGDPPLMRAHVSIDVTKEGFLLYRSANMSAIFAAFSIPLPKILGGQGTVLEGYDDEKDVFTIHVSFTHAIFGSMMLYVGQFQQVHHADL